MMLMRYSMPHRVQKAVVAADSAQRSPAKTRVDQAPGGAGTHPHSPGAAATVARLGTHGASRASEERSLDVGLSCVAFRERRARRAFSRLQHPHLSIG